MNKLFIILILTAILSCSKDNTTTVYPRTFTYQKTTLQSSDGVAMKDNINYEVIGSKTGNLKFFYDTMGNSYKAFAFAIGSGYINSFTLISKDSIKVTAISPVDTISQTVPSTENDPNGFLIDTSVIGEVVKYDKINEVINVCMQVFAGYQKYPGNKNYTPFADLAVACDNSSNPLLAINNYISSKSFNNGDTIGVYFLNLSYK
jgi:hypothetical protein